MENFMNRRTLPGISCVMICFIFFIMNPAYADLKGIAKLDGFRGDLLVKSLGSWGVAPQHEMPLYTGDKIFTENGTGTILFHDGSVLDIQPNSVIRVVEHGEKDVRDRDIRVLLGKVRYKSGKTSKAKVKLISPMMLAGLTRTEVWFGTDGTNTYLKQISGSSEKIGNVIIGDVPDIKPLQTAKDLNFQASVKSRQIWKDYFAAKEELAGEKIATEVNAYKLKSRSDQVISLEGEQKRKKHIELMGRLSKYTASVCEENITENDAFANHADVSVTGKAKEAKQVVGKALSKSREVSDMSVSVKQEIASLEKQRLSRAERHEPLLLAFAGAGVSDIIRLLADRKGISSDRIRSLLMKSMLEYNSMYEKSAMAYMIIGDVYTSGIPGLSGDLADFESDAGEITSLAAQAFDKVKTYIRQATESKSDEERERYLILAEMNAELIAACASEMSLSCNLTEAIQLLRSETVGDETKQEAVIKALIQKKELSAQARQRIADIVRESESLTRRDELDNNRKKIREESEKIGSSNEVHENFFIRNMRRFSMILSGPVPPELNLNGDALIPGLPTDPDAGPPLEWDNILKDPPVTDSEPASPI